MITACLVIAAIFVVLLACFCGYIALDLVRRGGFWNNVNGANLFTGTVKATGYILAAIFQAISEANQ